MPVRKMEMKDLLACKKIQFVGFVGSMDVEEAKRDLEKEGCPPDPYVGYENGDGIITACMELPRYQMGYDGGWVPMLGVGGVASLPEYREGGAVREILRTALGEARDQGVVFSLLYPFSHGFYRKFGYELCHTALTWEMPASALASFRCTCRAAMLPGKEAGPELKEVFAAHFSRYNLACRREDRHWEKLLGKDPYKERVYTYLLTDGEGPLAYVVVAAQDGPDFTKVAQVREMAWARPRGLEQALGFLHRLSAQYGAFRIPLPQDVPLAALVGESYDLKPAVSDQPMARVVHVAKALEGKAHFEGAAYTLQVTDDFLPENQGTYQVRCREGRVSAEKLSGPAPADLALDVRTLAQLSLGFLSLEEALYKPDVTLSANRETLERVFAKRPLFLTEHF